MAQSKPKTVLVAIDESEHSTYALKWALNTLIVGGMCNEPADKVILVHAKDPPASRAALGGPGFLLSADVVLSIERAQDREVAEIMNRAKQLCDDKKVTVDTVVVSGDARDVICDTAEQMKTDVLVVGCHGYGAIKRAVLGSVSDYCAHHAKCPVVIVRKPHKKSDVTEHNEE